MMKAFSVLAVCAVLLMPATVLAAPSWIPIVPCGSTGQPDCTPCYMFKAVENTSDLIFKGITGPVAAFMFVLAGGMMLLGAGNTAMQQRARRLFTNTALGVGIILIAWIATNFVIKSIAPNSTAAAGGWFHFECPAFLATINAGGTVAPAIPTIRPVATPEDVTASSITTAQMQETALGHHEPYPRRNAPALKTLIQCIYQDPVIQALAFPPPDLNGSARQTTGIVTYDNNNEYCNYSRGVPLSGGGACAHSVNSCHYGGSTGSAGAEAVDFNARLASVPLVGTDDGTGQPLMVQATEENLFCQLYNLLVVRKQCSDFGFINWESNHTHISTNTCTVDSGVSRSSVKEVKALNCANGARIPAPTPAP